MVDLGPYYTHSSVLVTVTTVALCILITVVSLQSQALSCSGDV